MRRQRMRWKCWGLWCAPVRLVLTAWRGTSTQLGLTNEVVVINDSGRLELKRTRSLGND
jgi:predicted anti-sigma-YlaC factor YlaD